MAPGIVIAIDLFMSLCDREPGQSRRDLIKVGVGLLTAATMPMFVGCADREMNFNCGTIKAGNNSMTTIPPHDAFAPAPVVPLESEPPARLIVDSPLAGKLAVGLVVVRYRTENLRIVPVYGPAALGVSPRIGHLHLTVDDAPWHWVDASGEPIVLKGLPPGPHTLLVELADPTHKVIDRATVKFEIPQQSASRY